MIVVLFFISHFFLPPSQASLVRPEQLSVGEKKLLTKQLDNLSLFQEQQDEVKGSSHLRLAQLDYDLNKEDWEKELESFREGDALTDEGEGLVDGESEDLVPAEVEGLDELVPPGLDEVEPLENVDAQDVEAVLGQDQGDAGALEDQGLEVVEDNDSTNALEEDEGVAFSEEEKASLVEQNNDDKASFVAAPEPEMSPTFQDEPNKSIERRLSRIFYQFNNQPTTDEEWLQIAGANASEVYVIQVGDTLWDISITFFGNGFFWPKIWQLNNKGVTNPHFIAAGRRLVFTPGGLNTPPEIESDSATFKSEGKQEEGVDLQSEDSEELTFVDPATGDIVYIDREPEIPAPSRAIVPPLRVLPPSLPPLVSSASDDEYDEDGFAMAGYKTNISAAKVAITTYLSEIEPEVVGEVVGIEAGGGKTAGTYQYVFLQSGNLKVGDSVTSYSKKSWLDGPDGEEGGYPVEVSGHIKLTDLVNTEENIYRGLVVEAVNKVEVGQKLLRGSIPRVDTSLNADVKNITATILGGHLDRERQVLGSNAFVFLDRGSRQGLNVGDMLEVMKVQTIRNKDNKKVKVFPTTRMALLKVAKTTENRATAFVLRSSEAIKPGYKTGRDRQASSSDVREYRDEVFESDDNTLDEEQTHGSFDDEFEDMIQ